MRKFPLLLIPLALWSGTALADLLFELKTPTFVALVVDHCPSGALDCEAELLGVNKTTNESVYVHGRTLLSGNAPNMVGYIFKNGDITYSVYVDYEKANLWIHGKQGLLLSETGTFIGL
jgi:hypothetical protein